MKVERITAQVRYSQDTGHGAWKAVEIGAEATVDERERWAEALAHLYADLGQELKTLWSANGNGHKLQESPQDGAEGNVVAPQPVEHSKGQPEPVQQPEHFCQVHQTEHKRYSRGNSVWYAHKTPDGKWCREK